MVEGQPNEPLNLKGGCVILTIQEDNVLRVYDSPEAVALDVEALDAEETLRLVFDERCEVYQVCWDRPNKRGPSHLGISVVENGAYHLEVWGRIEPADAVRAIDSVTAIEPSEAVQRIQELRETLRSSG